MTKNYFPLSIFFSTEQTRVHELDVPGTMPEVRYEIAEAQPMNSVNLSTTTGKLIEILK